MALRLAVLLSGSGTTLQNILDKIATGIVDAEVVCVVGSRPDAFGLERARGANVPAYATSVKYREDPEQFNREVWGWVREHKAELVVMAGFMCLLEVPEDYAHKIINVHPALLPAFGGQGLYGDKVHQAVLDYGARVSGCTVHFVDAEYDRGPVIMQEPVPVFENDTVETLAQRVQAREREVYIRVLQLFARGRIRVEGRKVKIT